MKKPFVIKGGKERNTIDKLQCCLEQVLNQFQDENKNTTPIQTNCDTRAYKHRCWSEKNITGYFFL